MASIDTVLLPFSKTLEQGGSVRRCPAPIPSTWTCDYCRTEQTTAECRNCGAPKPGAGTKGIPVFLGYYTPDPTENP